MDRAYRVVDPDDGALRREGLDLRFLTTVTAFQAPQNIMVEGMRMEVWYPADEATAAACRALV